MALNFFVDRSDEFVNSSCSPMPDALHFCLLGIVQGTDPSVTGLSFPFAKICQCSLLSLLNNFRLNISQLETKSLHNAYGDRRQVVLLEILFLEFCSFCPCDR